MSLDVMISSRDSRSVLKHRLIAAVASAQYPTIFAFEGPDDKIVYARWIRRLRNSIEYEPFIVYGKRNSRVLSWIIFEDQGELMERVSIFVDRDFDDLIEFCTDVDIFVTDRYSIENYLVSFEAYCAVIEDDFPLHGEPLIREKCQAHFSERFQEIQNALQDINKSLFAAARSGVKRCEKKVLNLNCFVEYNFDKIGIVEFRNSDFFMADDETFGRCIQQHQDEFFSLNKSERYRGKFYWNFFVKFINDLATHCKAGSHDLFEGVRRDGAKIGEVTLGGLAARSPMPDGLASFLEAVLD